MNPATISYLGFGGRRYVNVAIREVGAHWVPQALLAKPLFARALEVVRVSVDRQEGRLVLEPQNNIVTTELLTDDVRLEILPKAAVSPAAFHLLLQWSAQPLDVLPEQRLPVEFEQATGLYDLFVGRFLRSLEEVERNGWLPELCRRGIAAESILGDVDAVRSLEHLLTRLEMRFYQTVNMMEFEVVANRVLRTALACIALSRASIAGGLVEEAQQVMSWMPPCSMYDDPGQALAECQDILGRRTLDASRSYYYPALDASMPILKATSRVQRGDERHEDLPFRISMPDTYERAMRNITAAGLGRGYRVAKEAGEATLYVSASPPEFNPGLEPDIVIRPLDRPDQCVAVLDVKYKERPTGPDHYQLSAYMSAYKARFGGFITLADTPVARGPRSTGTTTGRGEVVEYAIYPAELEAGIKEYTDWLKKRVNSLAGLGGRSP